MKIEDTSLGSSLAALRFMVVEDHGFQRWALANTLADMGAVDVTSASDGRAALDVIAGRDGALDVIVTDVDMPGMDGLEFIRHLGELGVPVAVILASGLDHSLLSTIENMARAYGVEILATLEKPVTARKLAAALQRYQPRAAAVAPCPAHAFQECDVREAMANDEFEPFFQPKVRFLDAAVAGAEALARWRHPTKGWISPAAFIPLVEAADLGEKFALMIAAKAARACSSWRAQGLPGSVSVNVSPDVLAHLGFAERLLEVVHAESIQPMDMTLEVTESTLATPEALENLSRLRMRGFGIAIDDYGIGYSSMERLTHIAFTELKIDRSFVRDALTQPSSLAMLESSLETARKLHITAVAEGVERSEEWSLLARLGCDQAQGFLIATPMEQDGYVEWLRLAHRTHTVPGADIAPHSRLHVPTVLHRQVADGGAFHALARTWASTKEAPR